MTTVRIFFEKCGESAYISLLDLQRVFHRMLKMSSLPVYYTQGFNPHIYLSFTCPLSLGQESLCESCEVKTEQETIDPQAWIDALQPLMPRGIVITKVAPAVEKVGEIETAAYEITMTAGSAIALDAYNNAEHAEVTKKTKRGCKTLELKHYLDRIEYTIEGGTLRFTALLPCGSGEALNLNPSLLTDFLRTQGAAPVWQCRVVRTHLYNKAGKDFEYAPGTPLRGNSRRSGGVWLAAEVVDTRAFPLGERCPRPRPRADEGQPSGHSPFTGNCSSAPAAPPSPQGKAKAEKIFVFLSKPPCQTRCTML